MGRQSSSSACHSEKSSLLQDDSIKTARVVMETMTECYESTCEWSPVVIDGSCSTEEPDDNDEPADGYCKADPNFFKSPAASMLFRAQNLSKRSPEPHKRMHADVAMDFQRPELKEPARGDRETPETEDGSSTTTHSSAPTRMRNSCSAIPKRIRKETTESFHVFSTDGGASDDLDNVSEASYGSNKTSSKISELHPAMETDVMLHSDEAEYVGKCFVIAFDIAMQSEMSQDLLGNQALCSLNSTVEGESSKVFTAESNLPRVLAVEVARQGGEGGGDAADAQEKYFGSRQPGEDAVILHRLLEDSSNSSDGKVHEFSITGGSVDDDTVSDDLEEGQQDSRLFASANKAQQPEEASAEDSGRIVFEVLGSHDENSTSSSSASRDDNFLYAVDSKTTAKSSEIIHEGVVKLGVSAEFDELNNYGTIRHATTYAERRGTSKDQEDSQYLVLKGDAPINNSYTHTMNRQTTQVKTRVVFASEIANCSELLIADYNEASRDDSSSSASLIETLHSENSDQHQARPNFPAELLCTNSDIAAPYIRQDNKDWREAATTPTPDIELDYISSSRSSSAESECVNHQEVKKVWAPWCRNRVEAKY